ncbi:MAG: CDP-diacylglycerol--glycerol-3-phosphate 3-phosphatidyltransferase [Clostridium sp.]|nr:CDP-diacylglycerol--glycerol-3-phosphate 3-phosphatidyltransferase [Clostridium sp.]
MNLPNKLTIFRITLVPFFLLFISIEAIPYNFTIATVIFLVAALTDHLDGRIARSQNIITDFGKFMDPLADKLLVTAALIALVEYNLIGGWIAVIIIAREFAVSGLRTLAANEGTVIAASVWGKVKTTTQMVAVVGLLIELISLNETYLMELFKSIPALGSFFSMVPIVIMYVATFFTILSGIDYFRNGKEFINIHK